MPTRSCFFSTIHETSYDNFGRLATVTEDASTTTYGYVANSMLVGQITSVQGAVTFTTSRQYDVLNRLQSISSVASGVPTAVPMPISYAYEFNNANQRTRATMADNSYWVYIYDNLGQVISGKRYWQVNNTPVAGQQFEYTFDDIGNRKSTKVGGDAGGTSLRPAAYVVDLLNRYGQREVSGAVDILGLAVPSTAVTVNGNSTYRKGEYFHYALPIPNSGAAQYTTVTVNSGSESSNGKVFVPRTPEQYDDPGTTAVNEGYDADGNQLRDGRWNYTWDAENRLIKMESISGAPAGSRRRLEFSYDYQGRRIWRRITNLDTSAVLSETKFLYDGWNLIAELNAANSVIRKYVWGTDLSGSMQGAGGVGGLLKVIDTANGSFFCAYDGNGNLTGLIKATDGSIAAQYEYGPFGELLRATGPTVGSMAKLNPFRFSTKYQDDETDLLYYGYRYYYAHTGRWISRDPIEEWGGVNLYALCGNAGLNGIDALGLHGMVDPCPCSPPRSSDRKSLTISFHGNILDPATGAAAWNALGAILDHGNTIHVDVTGSDSLSEIQKEIQGRLKNGDCIESISISAHGFGGAFGTWGKDDHSGSDDTAVTLADLQRTESEASSLFKYLGSRMCNNNCGVVLKACDQAKGDGRELMKLMAVYMNTSVVGWDDVYGIVPHGDKYTACPDGTFKKTGTGEPFAGSLVEFFYHKRWKNKRDKDNWKRDRDRLKQAR